MLRAGLTLCTVGLLEGYTLLLHSVNALCRDSVISIATRYVLDDPGHESMWRQDIFTSTNSSTTVLGTLIL